MLCSSQNARHRLLFRSIGLGTHLNVRAMLSLCASANEAIDIKRQRAPWRKTQEGCDGGLNIMQRQARCVLAVEVVRSALELFVVLHVYDLLRTTF